MMITIVDDYFTKGCGRCERFATPECSTRPWQKGLAGLRRICQSVGLVEAVKWGHPCYAHADRNIVIIGALREYFSLGFFGAELLKDPHGVLERSGPNTQHADRWRFTDNAQVAKMEPLIREYLQEAMGYAAAGIRPKKETPDITLPDELVDALDADPAFADAFHLLTPGRQRSYVIHLSSAKTSETRIARILRFRDKVMAGKGFNER